MPPQEPTADQCENNAVIFETGDTIAYAIWYPQMGGYGGKAVAVMGKSPESCVDVFVWHDGSFPFRDDQRSPVKLHHCNPAQFIEFGEELRNLQSQWG